MWGFRDQCGELGQVRGAARAWALGATGSRLGSARWFERKHRTEDFKTNRWIHGLDGAGEGGYRFGRFPIVGRKNNQELLYGHDEESRTGSDRKQ